MSIVNQCGTMTMAEERRTVQLGIRMKPSLKRALEKAAKADSRTLASYIELALTEHLREKGFLK